MILTLKELANYLRVNERTILRMQQVGQINGVKIGGQWRFNGSEIDQLFFPSSPTDNPDAVPLADFTRSHLATPLSRIIREDRINMELKATDRDSVIAELCDIIQKKNLALDVKDLRSRILAREDLLSTAVGNNIAVPHPRDPVPTLSEPSVIVVGRSVQGIDFGAPDGKPVNLVFMLCNQSIEMHLHVLGRLAKMLRSEATTDRLKQAADAKDFLREIMDVERVEFLNAEE